LNPCVYAVFDTESALELNPEVGTLTPGTPCIQGVSGGIVNTLGGGSIDYSE